MKLKEFKTQLQIYTRGDIKAPEFDELKILMSEAAADIHRAITPLEKIEIDIKNIERDYFIDDRYFVRKFKEPENEEDEVDFLDKMLIKALMCGVAFKRSIDEKQRVKYKRSYMSALTKYELNNFDDRSYDLEASLRVKGWMKPYVINSALDNYYEWDVVFIKNLDYYMANIPKTRDLSCEKFIRLFFDYQNKKIDPDREDLRELDRLMKNKIREI
ncbi:hypothetical protein ACHJH3_08685 [Campylobacter sp. MOP7]|uniref:hypothetical protein n=1 Tax=Campylobacter canis TaxID=3378588 RepID=UPI00387E31C3